MNRAPTPNDGSASRGPSPLRLLAAGLAGVAVTLAANALSVVWLGAAVFATNAFYDGCALFLTLALPSLVGGVVLGAMAREWGLQTAAGTFLLFCLAGLLWHPFWRIPLVSPQSVHSGLMHYFLYNPLVALAFGALGAWFASQFVTGRFSLADREPVSPSPLED